MFDNLIDNLDASKWKEITSAEKNAANWKEYHVMKNHKNVCKCVMGYCVAVEDGDPKNVVLNDCKDNSDPLKQIGTVELWLSEDEKEVLGIDLNDDVVVRL